MYPHRSKALIAVCALTFIFSGRITTDGAENRAEPLKLLPETGITGNSKSAVSEEASTEVVCPPLRLPFEELENGPGKNDWRQPELVAIVKVVGTAIQAGRTPADIRRAKVDEVYEVEKVIYGSYTDKTIRLEPPEFFDYRQGDKFLVAAAPSFFKEQVGFNAFYELPLSEEPAEAALCQARLDYAALSSVCIFIGKEISLDWEGEKVQFPTVRSTVEVERVIHGAEFKAGAKLRVSENGAVQIVDYHRRAYPEPRIYFISQIKQAASEQPICDAYTHLPIDQEAKVRQALGRRNAYATYDKEEGGVKVKYQEIVFRGTNAEAMELLGAMHEGARLLGYRALMQRHKLARPEVVAAIEKDMFKLRNGGGNKRDADLDRLMRLIDVLGGMEKEDGGGDIEKLVEKYFTHLEQGLPEVNPSFTWLLMKLGQEQSREKYGKRLLVLYAKASGDGKNVIQAALDALKVEDPADTLELADAMRPMLGVKSVRSSSSFGPRERAGISMVAFSHDGKLLVTYGLEGKIRLWRTEDWTEAATIEKGGSISRVLFSPDDRFLYVAGGGGGLAVHARYDTSTGKLDKAYQGHHAGIGYMELSPDGRTMVTSSYYENLIHFWDTENGNILRTIKVEQSANTMYPSPDGKGILRPASSLLARTSEDRQWIVEPFRGEGGKKISLPQYLPNGKTQTSIDGTINCYVYISGGFDPFGMDEQTDNVKDRVIWGRWEEDGFQKLGEKDMDDLGAARSAVSPNGKILAVAGQNKVISFFSLPKLELLGRVAFPEYPRSSQHYIQSVVFSPDSKILALGMDEPAPGLIRTDTFEKLLPKAGHVGDIANIFFTADGKQLRTLGNDNLICTWDAATLKMLRRIEIPGVLQMLSIREPDGRYAICSKIKSDNLLRDWVSKQMGADNELAPGDDKQSSDKESSTIQIFDTETGKVSAEVAMPMNFFRSTYWINDHEALMSNDKGLCRFDYIKGTILGKVAIDESMVVDNGGVITDDGRMLVHFFDDGLGRFIADVRTTDVATGKVASLQIKARLKYGPITLVPGGKYFCLTDPNVTFYDLRTLDRVSQKELKRIDIHKISFNGDGSRYALVTGGSTSIKDIIPNMQYDPETQGIVRIHDASSGKTLLAFPISRPSVAQLKFSPESNRLAVVNYDNTIEVWSLPVVK
jgi:WD40 repeat protein